MRLNVHMEPGMLLVAGGTYPGASLWRSAATTGAELLWRVRRDTDLPIRRHLTDGSFLSEFAGTSVRVVECAPGCQDEPPCCLLTTIREPARAPADELASLFHGHWEAESAPDEIETTLLGGNSTLRSKTPQLVRQEIEGLMLAHYAVRHFLYKVARQAD